MLRVTSRQIESFTTDDLTTRVTRLEKSLGDIIHALGGLRSSDVKSNLRKLEDMLEKREKDTERLLKEIKDLKRRLVDSEG